jgi:GDSL-like Lipase/Acylhydrolase family
MITTINSKDMLLRLLIIALLLHVAISSQAATNFSHRDATNPAQIPLCMIGDSITWASQGDYWRKYLLEHIPRLAFIGTHTGRLGYSHAGEGGNSTNKVLERINLIPDCPYYSLLIGTNDTNMKDESKTQKRAIRTAERIQTIVMELLKKKGVKKVFLCSILPCFTKNPLRDKTNSLINVILRRKIKTFFPKEKVVWVEFEKPIRAINGWKDKIRLHPTHDGYKIIAKIHAKQIAKSLGIEDMAKVPVPIDKTYGIRITNLWDRDNATTSPIVVGWYTLSFNLINITGLKPSLEVFNTTLNANKSFNKTFSLSKADIGTRVILNLFTGQKGGWNGGRLSAPIKIKAKHCVISKILLEKSRPSKKASIYSSNQIYIDSSTKPMLGELIEFNDAKILKTTN